MSLLWVLLLATGAFAAPPLTRRGPECQGPNRFSNRVFTYNYEGETVSGIVGSSSARSALRIRARVVINPVGGCQHSLKIDSTELWESQTQSKNLGLTKSEKSSAFAVELEAHELVFSTMNGVITDLLPHAEEPTRILNIKRGILSTLQAKIIRDNSTENEVDVSGECSAKYAVHSRYISRRPKVISKSKDLADCTEHARTNVGISTHPYNEKPISLLKSTSNCRYALTAKNLIRQVVCQEEHLFRPFSAGYNSSSGAMTTTKQVLKLLNVGRSSERPPTLDMEAERKTLKYEHEDMRSTDFDIQEVKSTLIRLARDSMKMTRPESARLFSHLVKSIRKLNVKAMELVWNMVFECDKEGLCKEDENQKFQTYLLDALPHCGSEGCARVMSYAIKNELVNNERSNMFLAGIAMVSVPTEKVISDLLMLVRTNPSRTGMLTLGTLMHKFCEINPQCQEDSSIIPLAEGWLQDRLGDQCNSKTADEAEEILLTLKAIGNAGRPVSAQGILMRCALNGNTPINVSIAALEATRRMPSTEELTEQLLTIYAEDNVDVEIRLAAYLALMNCPSAALFKRIAAIQKKEVNNQVGSFVWSHLTNALESTEPVHGVPMADMIKEALEGSELREFNLNRLRFSRAWEGSFYSDVLRAGGSAQSHLIYHPNSYFPRSARLNLTADILGASINVLETAARFEGFEILVEQLFGKEGYYPDDRIMKMFDLKAPEERDEEEKLVNVNVRGKRSLSDDVNKVEKHLNKMHEKMNKYQHHPSGAVSVKIFGNEMRLISFDDISWLQSEADNINMVDMLIKLARGGKKSFTKSFMFLDADTTVPTILGLPLKLHAEGSVVASLELAGKFDIRNMFWGPMSFDVRGYIKPSANVEITGRMGVDAGFAEAGILVNSSLYTSTQIKGNATYKQKDSFRFEIDAPEAPMQIINISSSLFTTLNGEEVAIDGERRIQPAPCFNMTRVLGISACGQLSLPLAFRNYESPFFPLSGPASFSMSIERTDPKLRMYQILATRKPSENKNEYDITAKMSTPNATWEREFETNVTLLLKKEEKIVSASMGALGYKLGKVDGWYNNVTNAANLTFSTRDAIYGYPIVLSAQYFNNSDPEIVERELGMKWFLTFKNYTVNHLTKVYNRSQVYGYVSNTSYWRGMYLYSGGEVSIPQKSVAFVANHTCTKTSIRFDGSLGEEENKFVFNFTNKPSNVGIKVTGNYMKSQREAMLNMFVKPYQQSFTLRGSFAKVGLEKGVHFTASHDNKKRAFTWYTGIVNATNAKSIKVNASLLGRPLEAVWTYFNLASEKGIRFNALALDNSMATTWSYINLGQKKSLKFNASALNKTIKAAWTILNARDEKTLTFNGSALNKTVEAAWTYVNMENEKALKFNASAMNRTVQSTWVFINNANQKTLKVNATALNKTANAVWSFVNLANQKILTFNATMLNKTADATWMLINLSNQKSLRFDARVLNKTVQATWSFISFRGEKSINLNASALNKTIQAVWTYLDFPNEKSLKFNAGAANKTLETALTWVSYPNQRSLKFNASALNKTVEAVWSFMNLTNEKSLKFSARALNKTMEAAWTFVSLTNEKSLKFNATGSCNRSIEAAWTFLSAANEKSLKFNATALNKTMEAAWTFVNLANEKSLKFNATGSCNRSIEAAWTFVSAANEKSLKFNATALNKTVEAAWTFVSAVNAKSLKFNATALNKTVEAAWTFVNLANEKSLKFNATGSCNRSIEAAWTYVNLANEKALKFSASAMNKTVEASWNLVTLNTEKSLSFKARALNQTVAAGWTFMNLKNEKSVKFNATAFNKTVETMWTFVNLTNAKTIKFSASVLNKTMVAMWTYLKGDQERMIKFYGSNSNDTMEVAWTLMNYTTEKGIRINATIMRRTFDASLRYFRTPKDMGVRFNASAFNKTIELLSKMLIEENERKIVTSATYQNYTYAMIGLFQNLATHKSFCMHLKAVGKTCGEACLSFTNSSSEKSLSANVSAMNRSAELKTEWFKSKTSCDTRFSAKLDRTTILESWVSLFHTTELTSFRLNATAMNKSVEATWYFQSKSEKAVGMDVTALGRHVGIKVLWFNSQSYKLASIHLVLNKTRVALSSVSFLNTLAVKRVEVRSMVGEYFGEIQNEYRLHADGRHDLMIVRALRNGSKQLFFDTSRLSYTKTEKRRQLLFSYNLKVLSRSFQYGWDVAHDNFSTSEELVHTLAFGLSYSKGKRISLTSTIKNNTEELSQTLLVEYLPEKFVEHQIIWVKASRLIDVRIELLPRVPLLLRTAWNTKNGFYVSSVLSAFRKEIRNSFMFDKETESFKGHFEICPVYPLDFSGKFSRSNGLLFTSSIKAFKRTWNHRIELNKEERKVLISIEPIPRSPMVFQATLESAGGMRISVDMTAFKRSLQWEGMYEKLTKTLTSDLTVFNQKISLLQGLDVETKTLALKLTALKHTFGFIGRLDWDAYVASAYLTYGDKRTGWFLMFDPSSRNAIFNITLTPTISVQIAGEMPTDTRLQVTLQRKFGVNIVNESRLVYDMKPEASRVFLTWNKTTTTNLMRELGSVTLTVVNVTMKLYNRTIQRVTNLTKALDDLMKKMETEIKPQLLKMYKKMRTYDYKGLMENTKRLALNATLKMVNLTVETFNRTIRNLAAFVRNTTDLYKNISKAICSMHENVTKLYNQLCKNATVFYHKLRTVVIPPVVGNISLHLSNITKDLKAWSQSVTLMLTNMTVRGEKVGVTLKRIAMKVESLTKELINNITFKTSVLAKNITIQAKKLIKNITIQAKALMAQIRNAEIRGQKLGPLFDKYMVKVRNVTCNFNALCTLDNLTGVAMKLSMRVRRMTVLNKTINQHIIVLRKEALVLRRQVMMLRKRAAILVRNITELSQNLTETLPKFLRNVTIQVIYLARNFTRDIRNVSFRVRNVTMDAYLAVKNFSDPLVKHLVKISTSLYHRAKPSALKMMAPVVEFTFTMKGNVVVFMKPVVEPLVPLAYNIMYQVRNITVRRVPIGIALDKAVIRSTEAVVDMLKMLNQTVTSNVSAAIYFIKETSQKTPEEIVDITVKTCERFYNFTRRTFNQTVQLGYNMSKLAVVSLNNSVHALNRTLQKVLKMAPDQIVEVSVRKLQIVAANLTFEVLNITKQLRSFDVIKPVKMAWEKLELKKKIDELELDVAWKQLLERVKAVDIRKRVISFRTCLANLTTKALSYMQKIANVSFRALNLTRRLGRIDITKEEFMKELYSVGKEMKHIIKEASMVGNLSLRSYERLWNRTMAVYRMSEQYKNLALNKTLDALEVAKKFSLALYSEHEIDTMKVLDIYKKMALKVYEDVKVKIEKKTEDLKKDVDALKVKLTEKVDALKLKLTEEMYALVKKLRQYENMTYEEVVEKVYSFTKTHGLALYNNVTLRVMKFYNETRNMTLDAYNRTLVWVNHTTVVALEYYNFTRNQSMKYYKIGRNISMAYYNVVRNRSMQYYQLGRNASMRCYSLARNVSMRYYSLGRNYTIMQYNRARNLSMEYLRMVKNLTLFAYNITRNFTLRTYNLTLKQSLEVLLYVNKTLVPRLMEYIAKGKLVVEKTFVKSTALAKFTVKEVKEWYEKNKEKTVEELYVEVYSLAKDQIDSVVIRMKDRVVKVLDVIQKLNKTVGMRVRNITSEIVSIFNQTVNITAVAGKQLVAIFLPCAQMARNKTTAYLLLVMNVSLPLIEKARNTTLKMLNQSRDMALDMYKKLMAHQDVQEFIVKYKLEHRFEMMVKNGRQIYKKVEAFFKETSPQVEARLNEVISYLKINLPEMASTKREELMAKRDEIMSMLGNFTTDPTAYAVRMYKNAFEEMMLKIKDTPIEMIVMHEVWGQFAEEIKQHEFFFIGGEILGYSKLTADMAVQELMLKLEAMQERVYELNEELAILKKRAQLKATEVRMKVSEGFEDFKKMKLRDLVEHSYIFKTIAMVKNVTERTRIFTLKAKNATLMWVAVGKMYAKNLTKNVTLQLQKLNATFQEFKRNVTLKFLAFKKNITLKFLELKYNVTLKFLELKNNLTLKFLEIKKNVTLKYLEIKNVTLKATLKYLEIKGNVTLKFFELKKNVILKLDELKKNVTMQMKKYTPIVRNYTNMIRNMTIKYYKVACNWTVMQVNASKLWLNKTLEKGIKYCQETVVPYYKTKVVPFYQDKLMPMYLNYSKIVVELSKNVTERAVKMKEKAIKTALSSNQDVSRMLRRFGKMTIRESVVAVRNLSIQAYAKALNYTLEAFNFTLEAYNNYTLMVKNYTLEAYNVTLEVYNRTLQAYSNLTHNAYNLTLEAYRNLTLNAYNYTLGAYNYTLNITRRAINITKVKYLAAKAYFHLMKRQGLKRAVPFLVVLNATRFEIMETVVFVNRYYGVEKTFLARYVDFNQDLKMKYAVIERRILEVIKVHAPYLVNATSGFLQYTNRTVIIRLVNRTIERLNRTVLDLVNKTVQYLNRTGLELVKSSVQYLNHTGVFKLVNKTITYLNRTGLRLVKSSVQYLNRSGVFKLVNKTIAYLNRTGLRLVKSSVQYLNRSIAYLNNTGVKLVNCTIRYLSRTGRSLVNSTMQYLNRTGVLSFVNTTLRYVNRTGVRGLVNITMVYFNKTILYVNQTGHNLVNRSIGYLNRTGVLSFVNNTMTYLNRTTVRVLVNHTIVYLNKTIGYLNRTSALRLVNRTLTYLKRTGLTLVNKTVQYFNRTGVLSMVSKTIVYLNQTVAYLNRTSALDLVNNTIRYLNRTGALNMDMAIKAVGYLNRTGLIFVNKTVVYLNRTGVLKMVNKTIVCLNQTVAYLNRTSALDLLNDTIRYLNRTGVLNVDLVDRTIGYLNRTGLVFVNKTVSYLNRTGVLRMLNKTIVYLNKTIGRLNRTCVLNLVNNTMRSLNRTMHLLNSTMLKMRMALPKYISVKDGVVSIVIPHLGSVRGNIKYLSMVTVQKVRNLTRMALNMSRQALNASRVYLEIARNRTRMLSLHARNITMRVFNMTQRWTIKVCNLTGNMTTMKNCNLTRAMVKVYKLTKNMTIRVYNLAKKVTMKVYNLTKMKIYILTKDMSLMKAYNLTRNMTMKVYNITKMRIYALSKDMSLMKAYNLTRNITMKVYNVTKMRIYALSKDMSLMKAYNLTRNMTMKVYNITKMRIYALSKDMSLMKAYNLTRNMTMKVYNITKARIYALSKDLSLMKAYNLTRNMTMKLYNITKAKIYALSKDMSLMKAYNLTRNMTMKVFNLTRNITLSVYKLAYNRTLNVAMKVYNLTYNATVKVYTKLYKPTYIVAMKVYNRTYNLTMKAFNQTYIVAMKVYNRTYNLTMKAYRLGYNMTMKVYRPTYMVAMRVYNRTYNLTMKAYNQTYIVAMKVYNRTYNLTMKAYRLGYNMTMKVYRPTYVVAMRVYNRTYNLTMKAYNQTYIMAMKVYNRTYNLTVKAYNQTYTVAMKVYNRTYNLTMKAHKMTMKVYNQTTKITMRMYNRTFDVAMGAFNRTRSITMKALRACRTSPMTRDLYNQTVRFYLLTRKFVKEFEVDSVVRLTKTYLPLVMRMSREWCSVGLNSTRSFTVRAAGIAWYVSRDIYNSSSLREALTKAKNLSRMAYQGIRKLYRVMHISTQRKYLALYYRALKLYKRISQDETVLKCIRDARDYIDHSRKIMKMRMRHLRFLRRHLSLRIAHKLGRISALMNPVNWIPPFNSTAMIFGPSHVYTFDGLSYQFPGYKKADCTYVLARDVRDDKIKLLSQENALILVTEDMNVKVHQDGRVETMTKITVSGKKIRDGYDSELPVQSANTTVVRYGSFVVIKNTIGIEIICDMEHDMCTFNIARWYHGRMNGLLGSNNNEVHDELRTSDGKPANNLIDFVNSWQITKDPECRITENDVIKPTCPASHYHKRCREIFKNQASPLASFFNVSDPKPFLKACEYDYTQCKTNTPKDMRHCNATAAYIDLLRMKGEWVEYLPECGRCAQHEIGQRWFQTADKMVDVVLLVPETRSMRNFAQRLPEFVTSMTKELPKYSFRFGVVGFGGENIHTRPHMTTVNGQAFGLPEDIQNTIEHLKFPSEPIVNNTLDDFEAMRVASRYPFRAGASKIFLLLSGWDRETKDEARLNRTIRMLKSEAITLNVLGKYKRLQNHKLGQDYTGRMYYKSGRGNIVPLPAGELVKIIKNTEGSVFGASFLATVDRKTFRAAILMNSRAWNDQIKRDQLKCRECYCAKGDAGQGKSVCRVNTVQKC